MRKTSVNILSKHILDTAFVNSKKSRRRKNTDSCGFTLIEIIAVLSILAVLASLSLPKFMDLSANAGQKVFESAVTELNSREFLEWTNSKISSTGLYDDETLFTKIDYNLGVDYHWSPQAKTDGGILHFKDQMNKLVRTPSTAKSAGRWEISKLSTKSI